MITTDEYKKYMIYLTKCYIHLYEKMDKRDEISNLTNELDELATNISNIYDALNIKFNEDNTRLVDIKQFIREFKLNQIIDEKN